jgi:hypothetical protein
VNVQDREVDRILHVLQARLLKDEGLDATKVSESSICLFAALSHLGLPLVAVHALAPIKASQMLRGLALLVLRCNSPQQ